ncbi:hypothetical protein LJC10_04225 [Selenomonadales bacterium OttesenSCG-928-I06]|nr:hypothetical protein [Selenomonadales bacterium OttesenSCG-928-I06]
MQAINYKMIVIDSESHSLLLIDGETNEILSELSYPREYTPTDIVLNKDSSIAYVPTVGTKKEHVIFKISIKDFKMSLDILPITVPYPFQFALEERENKSSAYIAEPNGSLYRVDLGNFNITKLALPLNKVSCVGLATSNNLIFSAFEHSAGGTLTAFDYEGSISFQYDIPSIPTNIVITKKGKLIIPFTNTAFTGEGIAIFEAALDVVKAPKVITLQCPSCPNALSFYPCHAAITPNDKTAYIVAEDSASILVVDLDLGIIKDRLVIGRSISRLYLIADTSFAIATSYLFSDLCLIDLRNGQLTATSSNDRQFLSSIAILNEKTI